jgi:hypothetical protein
MKQPNRSIRAMLYDLEHPHVLLSDWQKFSRESSPLVAEIIDRDEAKLPDWLVPVAHGVFTASDALLRTAGHRDGMRRPRGWLESDDDVYIRYVDPVDPYNARWLLVRECFVQGLWMVERWTQRRRYPGSDEILVHQFGSTPIFTRSCPAAMRLAMLCHPKPRAGLHWIAA